MLLVGSLRVHTLSIFLQSMSKLCCCSLTKSCLLLLNDCFLFVVVFHCYICKFHLVFIFLFQFDYNIFIECNFVVSTYLQVSEEMDSFSRVNRSVVMKNKPLEFDTSVGRIQFT